MTDLHLVIGTPMYGGVGHLAYYQSCDRLIRDIRERGGACSAIRMGNESLIQRARNSIVHHFLSRADTTHLLFMDADQGFRSDDVRRMIEADKPVIVAPVPLKRINWEAVWKKAMTHGPGDLAYDGAVFNIEHDGFEGDPNVPFKIKRGGAGMMLIKRGTLERLVMQTWVDRYHDDTGGIDPNEWVVNLFPVECREDRLISEDYGFCNLWTAYGGEIWCAPWCEVSHYGTFEFKGSFARKYAATPTERET